MGCTVRELGERLDAEELKEWMGFDRIHPLPDPYWSSGLIASTMVNMWGKDARTRPEDFIPARKAPSREVQSAEDGKAAILQLIALQKARGIQ